MINEKRMRQLKARQDQQNVEDLRLQKHLPVAGALCDPDRAPEVVRLAMGHVQLWCEKDICSRDYIDAWERLLRNPKEAARVLRDPSPYAAQLRQNSPFVSTIRKLQGLVDQPGLDGSTVGSHGH